MDTPKAYRENTWDLNIFHSVYTANEYGIGWFNNGDIIMDVGCHIGSFSILAKHRGAGEVYCFEVMKENFEVAQKNLEVLSGIHLYNVAVTRSDKTVPGLWYQESYDTPNTGGGGVFCNAVSGKCAVEAMPFDSVLEEIEAKGKKVRLLKLDCEGSEFPILLTSAKLYLIDEIVGEFHNVNMDAVPEELKIEAFPQFDIETLHAFMLSKGFAGSYEYSEGCTTLGKFKYIQMQGQE